jgi:hypothetical protein
MKQQGKKLTEGSQIARYYDMSALMDEKIREACCEWLSRLTKGGANVQHNAPTEHLDIRSVVSKGNWSRHLDWEHIQREKPTPVTGGTAIVTGSKR